MVGSNRRITLWVTALAAFLIVAAAIAVRFWDLATNPGGLHPDEAVEGLSAMTLLRGPASWTVFFPNDGGREALYAYLVAGTFSIVGPSVLALRATAAAIGVLGVGAIGLLGWRFGRVAGLAAMAWAAGSLWLVAVSRDGFRNTIVPLFAALALVALIAWVDRPTRRSALLAGAALAIATFYTYTALRVMPLAIALWLAWLWRRPPPTFGEVRGTLRLLVLAYLVVGLPVLLIAGLDPGAYFGRSAAVAIVPGVGSSALIEHWLRTLGMFAFTGDPNPRHDVDGAPLLAWPIAIVAAIGLIELVRRRREAPMSLILVSLGVFLIPPLLAGEGGAPHFLRALGLAAPLGPTIGLGVERLVTLARERMPRAMPALLLAIAVAFAGVAFATGSAYLSRPDSARYAAFRYDLVALAGLADRGLADVVIATEADAYTIDFLDAGNEPRIVAPGTIFSAGDSRVFALDQATLATSLGEQAAALARPVAFDPTGAPSVWLLELSAGDGLQSPP